jgi:hypothetical protein
MNGAAHRIGRLRWHVKAPSRAAAFLIRQQLRTELDTVLLPVFDRAFAALGMGDEMVHIPRLEISLSARLDEDSRLQLAQLLGEQLVDALREAAAGSRAAAARLPAPDQRLQVLLDYLSTGQLTWHASTGDTHSRLATLAAKAEDCADALAQSPTVAHGSLEQRTAASFRLLQLLAPAMRMRLVERYWAIATAPVAPPATDQSVAALPSLLRQLARDDGLGDYPRLRVQSLLLALRGETLARPLAPSLRQFLEQCLVHIDTHHATASALRAILIPDADEAEPIPAMHVATASPEHRMHDRTPRHQAPEAASQATAGVPSVPAPLVRQDTTPMPADDRGWLVHDAGLVLLHPFLPGLFSAVELVAPGNPALAAAALPRAAALLHRLLSGHEDAFEFELATIKILLGLGPDSALPVARGLLTAADALETERLLEAAIGHWPALGKTSAAGLRTAFLQRRGILRDGPDGWQLRVEPASYDLLLGQLPWGIGTVKLPWMGKPLFTEWR